MNERENIYEHHIVANCLALVICVKYEGALKDAAEQRGGPNNA